MKNIPYISALALAAMLAACTGDEESAYMSDPNAVRINATVGETSLTRSNPAGTEEEQQKFNSGDKIAISDGRNNATYTLGSDGTWTSDKWLTWHSEPETFQAYYPADGNTYEKGTIQTDQSTLASLNQSDYMTREKKVETIPDKRLLDLTMVRRTSLVKISGVTYGDEFDGTSPSISAIKITSPSQYVPSDGTTAEITPYNDNGTYYAIVSPADAASETTFISLTVSYTEDGTAKTKDLTIKGLPAHKEATSYTYSLKVGKDEVKIGKVTVADWGSTATITGGEAESAYLAAKFCIGTDDSGNNKYVQFTNGNLQYDITAKKYQLASEQWQYLNDGTDYTVENSAVTAPTVIDLFSWGTGSNPTYASTEYADYSTYSEWGDYAKNDIAKLGDARTLSGAEWSALFQNQCCAMVELTDNEVVGLVVFPYGMSSDDAATYLNEGSSVTASGTIASDEETEIGRKYGEMTVANLVKSGALFLPAGGFRKASGKILQEVGAIVGYYWSNEKYDSGNYSIKESYHLRFKYYKGKMMEYVNVYAKFETLWTYGISIRLVKDVE